MRRVKLAFLVACLAIYGTTAARTNPDCPVSVDDAVGRSFEDISESSDSITLVKVYGFRESPPELSLPTEYQFRIIDNIKGDFVGSTISGFVPYDQAPQYYEEIGFHEDVDVNHTYNPVSFSKALVNDECVLGIRALIGETYVLFHRDGRLVAFEAIPYPEEDKLLEALRHLHNDAS